MNEANAYVRPDNGRMECRACRTQIVREKREAKAAQLPQTEKRFRAGYPDAMTCRTCGEAKDIREFGERKGAYKGTSYRNRSCKPCLATKERDYRLRKRYGIGSADYDALLTAQGGVCILCRYRPEDGEVLSVDHDHATGRVRGILCQPCNVAVGFFETRIDVDRLRDYLSR